ncbi:IS1595 family transposase [Vibrio parahaemolyticus]|uniref:IS1595 family transposase n=1 Tax=Gammaproteobacteria TaxID=1236 RepID=UPI0015FD6D72|nr:IS1595 family transposase [Vibrio cholerae]EGQ9107936.1 IS1595 family transposase [Vibrio cholerae]MBA8614431.1 IS1595 family transposase [Vibrio cholerae]MBE3864584.1 IS1595 family transposase [Vibrio parahaemolyticus]HCT9715967.1 IS1595 family transposase [Proteus mirabilis]
MSKKPKNKVKFQKGISLPRFFAKFGTETQCQAHLFRLRWPTGFLCPHCGHDKYCKLNGRALFQCNRCHHQASLTAGTLFAKTKLALTTWFLAIYLITQEKNGISSLELSRQLGISYNATWRLKHKLMQAMKERDDRVPLDGYIQLDDAYWGGVRRGSKGRQAKGKQPFVAAVALNEQYHPIKMRFSAVKGFQTAELTQWAEKRLTPKSLVLSDGLACFRGVKAAGALHHPTVTGGGPDCVEHPYFKWVNTMISNVKNAMHGTYHAIRLKHLPRYLAEFSYKFNRRFQLAYMIDRLLCASLQTAPWPYQKLKLAEARW